MKKASLSFRTIELREPVPKVSEASIPAPPLSSDEAAATDILRLTATPPTEQSLQLVPTTLGRNADSRHHRPEALRCRQIDAPSFDGSLRRDSKAKNGIHRHQV
jgi:hypothetical protein